MKFYIAEYSTYCRVNGRTVAKVHEIKLNDVGTPGGSKEGKALWSFVRSGEKLCPVLKYGSKCFFPYGVANSNTATALNSPVVKHKNLWSFFKYIGFNPRIPNLKPLLIELKRP